MQDAKEQYFTNIVKSAMKMDYIDDDFVMKASIAYNDLHNDLMLKNKGLYDYVVNKRAMLQMKKSTSNICSQNNTTFRVPMEVIKDDILYATKRTKSEQYIYTLLIEPYSFEFKTTYQLLLVYGLDKNGKTAMINNIFESLKKRKPLLYHLKEDGKAWNISFPHEKDKVQQLKWLIQYLDCVLQTNPNSWFLFEIEFFDEMLCTETMNFIDNIIKLQRIILVATTSYPGLCHDFLIKERRNKATSVFIDLPDEQTIGDLLQLHIFRFFHGCINQRSSKYIEISQKFSDILYKEIAPQLTCHEKIIDPINHMETQLRECSTISTTKPKYGITLGYLTQDLIPKFLLYLKNAKLNWIDKTKTCVYRLPNQKDLSCKIDGNGSLSKNIIKNEGSLTKNELISLHMGQLTCEDLETDSFRPLCDDEKIKMQKLEFEWEWVIQAEKTVFEIARQILVEVEPNDAQDILYESLVQYFYAQKTNV